MHRIKILEKKVKMLQLKVQRMPENFKTNIAVQESLSLLDDIEHLKAENISLKLQLNNMGVNNE